MIWETERICSIDAKSLLTVYDAVPSNVSFFVVE